MADLDPLGEMVDLVGSKGKEAAAAGVEKVAEGAGKVAAQPGGEGIGAQAAR